MTMTTKPAAQPRQRRPKLFVPQTMTRGKGFSERKVTTEGEAQRFPWELALARRVGQTLEFHYPGQPFEIRVDAKQGVLMIRLNPFMGNYWHVIHLTTIKSDPGLRCVIRAAGEILERYNIPRARFSLDHFLQAREQIPPWLLGRHGYVPT